MVASITRIHSPISFLLNQILICYSTSQIFQLCQIFKLSASYFYVTIRTCIPLTAPTLMYGFRLPIVGLLVVSWSAMNNVLFDCLLLLTSFRSTF
jgi:hypothetical protein